MTKCQVDQKDKNPFKNELNGIGILQNMIEIMSVINLIEIVLMLVAILTMLMVNQLIVIQY